MIKCPQCGAANQASRAACWNCWTPLSSTGSTPAVPGAGVPTPPPGSSAEPASAAPPPEADPQPEAIVEDNALPAANTADMPPAEEELLPVVQPPARAATGGGRWLVVVAAVVSLLLVAGMVYWYVTFRPRPHATESLDVARDYLAALVHSDVTAQQQLATPDSRGMLLPSWFTVVRTQIAPAVTEEGDAATVAVELYLGTPSSMPNSAEVDAAVTRKYDLTLPLMMTAEGWRVQQREFLSALHRQLQQENPGVGFPAWEIAP
jgi:hypothetical protein